MDATPIVTAVAGGLIGFTIQTGRKMIEDRRTDAAVRRQIGALVQIAMSAISTACQKAPTYSFDDISEAHAKLDTRLFDTDVAAAFNQAELNRLFDFALALRATFSALRQTEALPEATRAANSGELDATIRESAIVALMAAVPCLKQYPALQDSLQTVLQNLRADDPVRFASIETVMAPHVARRRSLAQDPAD